MTSLAHLSVGKWEGWNSWSACEMDCSTEEGVAIRTRECNYPCCARASDDPRDMDKGEQCIYNICI